MFRQEVIAEPNQHMWSQGCLLKAASIRLSWLTLTNDETTSPNKHTTSTSSPLNWYVEHESLNDNEFLVIVSHVCDIHRLPSKEPYIEAIRAFWTDDKGIINEAKTNSNRHFPLQFKSSEGREFALIADATKRVQIKKDDLLPLIPITCFEENDRATPFYFRQWLARRYDRQAVPDDIVEAVQKPIVKAVKKLKKTNELFRIFGVIWRIQYFIRDQDNLHYNIEILFIQNERNDISDQELESVAVLADWINSVLSENGNAELVYWKLSDTKDIYLHDFLHSYELPLDSYTLSGEYGDS